MTERITIQIASDVSRDLLVAELEYDGEEWAYVYEEGGALVLEIYPRSNGSPWVLDFEDALESLQRAALQLRGEPSG